MAKLIMVLNHDRDVLELIEDILIGEGYDVTLHSAKMQDLEDVRTLNPALILLDQLRGGEFDVWEFVQKLKLASDTALIPVIISTYDVAFVQQSEQRLKDKQIGVILKPYDIEDLLQAVSTSIGNGKSDQAKVFHPRPAY